MASYPATIYDPRTVVNKSGVVYDGGKTNVIFAEDINAGNAEIIAIENTLGINVQGNKTDLKTRLAVSLDDDGYLKSNLSPTFENLHVTDSITTDGISGTGNALWYSITTNSPQFVFQDKDTKQLILQKLDAGEAIIKNTEGSIRFQPNNISLAFDFSVDGSSPTLRSLSSDGPLIIKSDYGVVSFDDDNLITSGTLQAGTTLIDTATITDSTGAISFGDENLTTTGNFAVGNAADVVNLTLNGKASQTASYLKVIDSSSNTLFEVDDQGRVGIRGPADYRYGFYHNVTETLGDVAMTDFRFSHYVTCNTNNAKAHVGMQFMNEFSGSGNFTRTGGGGGAEGLINIHHFYGTGTITEATGLQLACFTASSQVVTEYKFLTIGSISNSDTSSVGTVYGINLLTMKGAGVTTAYAISSNDGLVVFNEYGTDYSDVRIEGDTDVNLFFTDASADKVGIGLNNPSYKLDVNGDINIAAASAYRVGGTAGVSGSFTSADSKTITVTKGIITNIA